MKYYADLDSALRRGRALQAAAMRQTLVWPFKTLWKMVKAS